MRLALVLSGREETRMISLTDLMGRWISCSNDLWLRWFATMENGADEFIDVERFLLRILVLEKGDQRLREFSAEQLFEKLRVIYRIPVNESRQICIRQRAGNVFCSGHVVSISKGDAFKIKSIDTMGTMQDGKPYVEVAYGDGYLLESPDLVEFVVDLD
jgi:hypothetical protein